MITTLTLSPCIDKTVALDHFDINAMNRTELISLDIGGKGINVSRALKRLDVETAAVGLNFSGGELIPATLTSEEIENSFVNCKGILRTNLKLFDRSKKNTIEINESNPEVDGESLDEVLNVIKGLCKKSECLVLSGSVPKGVPSDIYFRFSNEARSINPDIKIILDAQGELMLNSLKARPYMIKPNIFELETLLQKKLEGLDDIVSSARQIINENGVEIVIVSMGSEGAVIVTRDELHYIPAVKVDVKSTQGAGDSMVAGALKAILAGLKPYDILRYAVCSAAGAIAGQGTTFCSLETLNELLDRTK